MSVKLRKFGIRATIPMVMVITISIIILLTIVNALAVSRSSTPLLSNSVQRGSVYFPPAIIGSSSQNEQMHISIPLYASPNESVEWEQVVNSSPTTGILVINPDFGPGYSLDKNYVSVIQTAQKRGIDVLGYVYTSYGSVPITTVKNWIADWYSWYHVDGIFFDETNNTCSTPTFNYYGALYNYTKLRSGPDIVILNPGGPSGNCYAPISDIIVTFEGDYSQYVNNYHFENWVLGYPAGHFWNIVYNATTLTEMRNAITLASQRGSAWIYVTDGLAIGVNALGHLPSYFCEEVQALGSSSATCGVQGTAS